jgi:hypothetical protein
VETLLAAADAVLLQFKSRANGGDAGGPVSPAAKRAD